MLSKLRSLSNADYLNDHAIQGRVLLPGATMFEICNASIACLGITIGNFTMHSVSLSTPCSLQKPNGTRKNLDKVLKCCASFAIGRIDLKSITAPLAAQQPGLIHLSGTSGQLSTPKTNSWSGSLGTYGQEDSPSLPSKGTWGLPKIGASNTNEIVQQPTGLASLLLQSGRSPAGSFLEGITYEPKPSRSLIQARPNSTALIHTSSTANINHDGYVIHPAVLDAVTHTAAALDFEQNSKDHQPSAFLCSCTPSLYDQLALASK